MSCFTIQNIKNSVESFLKETKYKEGAIRLKTKSVSDEVKALLAERKTMSVSPSSATALDSALCKDVIEKYEDLLTDTKKTIRQISTDFSQLMKCIRKQKAVALLDTKLNSSKLPSECVFVSKFVPRSRTRIHREQLEYVASCVRVGGEYAVAMRRNNNSDIRTTLHNKEADKVFPLESRDEFVIDTSYPLTGFEDDIYGNTHAVFLTGLALGVKLPEKVPAAEASNGLHDIVIKGYRVAKVPVLCMFDTPNTITTMEFVKDKEMPDIEHTLVSETLETESENLKIANAAPEVEQKVYVYDFSPRKNPLFSLTANQVDGVGNSWCNMNSFRRVESGGFSGEDGLDVQEMNDISCFSDCIDISVSMWEKFHCCVTIESGRRLFEANPAPFTRSDATKYKINSTPITPSSTIENSNVSFTSLKMNNIPQEVSVLEKLIDWSEKTKYVHLRETEEKDCNNSWWCSYSPPLKIEEEEEEEEPKVERCFETEAAVKTAHMLDRLTLEQEVVPFLRGIIYSSIIGKRVKLPSFIQMKLTRSLQELKEKSTRHRNIWSTQSIKTAQALMIDEAYAASVAHQITHSIAVSGVFEGMCLSPKNDVYQGQRKYLSGLKMVNMTAMKQDGEREIDAALKEWIKSKLLPVPSFLTSYSERKKRGSVEQESPKKCFIKEDGTSLPCLMTSENNHQFTDLVEVIPPSFVRMPSVNMGRLAEDFADSFGRALCGMKNPTDVYQNMCSATAELRERLLTGPFRRFSPELELLYDTVKMEDIEQANMSVLDYESERLGKLLEESSFYQSKVSEALKKSCSWSMEIESDEYDNATKTIIIATTVKRIYEEYQAFKMLVNVFIFDKLRKELEGNAWCKNTSLTATFNWYCMIVARNRICDAFRHIVNSRHNNGDGLYQHFYENLTNNKIVVSIIINKVIDSLRWIMNTDIPSGFLKGLLDTSTPETVEARKSKITPCETIDETAKFVVPSLKIISDSATSEKSVRFAPHITGPVFVRVDLREIGLDRVKYGKLFINTVTGNGLLTASPSYDDGVIKEGEKKDSIFSDVAHDLISRSSSHNTKFLLSTAPSIGVPKGSGNALFDIRTFQNSSTVNNAVFTTPASKLWSRKKVEQSKNMWRCGFVIPKKLCDTIFDNRKSVKIIASPSKKSKTTSTKADSCICQNTISVEKVCKTLATFAKENSKILAKNLAASSLTKIIIQVRHCEDTTPIATCLMVNEKQLLSDNYSYAFFHFKCKSLNICKTHVVGEKKSIKENKAKEIDSLCVFETLQDLREILNRLHALKNKHMLNITSYRKKMKDAKRRKENII